MSDLLRSAIVTGSGLLGGTGASNLESDGGRSFLQQRIALLNQAGMLISLMFFVVGSLILTFGGWHTWATCWDRQLWHAVAIAVSFVVWQATRRRSWSHRVLLGWDALGSLLALGAYGIMSVSGHDHATDRVDLQMTLISVVLLLLRAVIIPSRSLHTAIVTALGMLPVLGVGQYLAWSLPVDSRVPPPAVSGVFSLAWLLATVAMTTLVSRTIYNLRVRVREAQRLGQYILDEKIGEGGMGAVYRARHALLRRPTAVKLILPERAGKTTIARFEREVQMTARLTHPNTVSVFDYGHTHEGVFYYAMEYLEGVDLELLVSEFGPQSPERVVHVLKQVCGALVEAHEFGLVHRDVKPANIILCERGKLMDTAKIVDFGLVKDLIGAGRDPGLSNVNSIVGTPLYLAPEALIEPDKVDARADLYALGAVAYYLLTGSTVFRGQSVMEICAQHLHAVPEPPSQRCNRPLPEGLERLVLRCLEKKPERRPSSAAELLAELEGLSLPAWTQQQARAWWREHGASIEPRRVRRSQHSPVGSALTVDVAARLAG